MDATTTKRQRGQHGGYPLSLAVRRRLLAALLERANSGEIAAAETLIRLSLQKEQVANPDAYARVGADG